MELNLATLHQEVMRISDKVGVRLERVDTFQYRVIDPTRLFNGSKLLFLRIFNAVRPFLFLA